MARNFDLRNPMPIRLELKCIDCGATFPLDEVRYTCDCGGLLDVARDLEELREHVSRETFDAAWVDASWRTRAACGASAS